MQVTLSRGATIPLAFAACATLAACKGKNEGTSTDSAVSTAAIDSSTAGGMARTTAAISDANIAALIDEANAGDSALAAAALPKLTSTGSKGFARLMMGEHHALHLEGLAAEKRGNITPQLPSPDPFKPAVEAEQSALSSMAKGTGYDSTYIANEVGIHQAVIAWAGKPANQPQNKAYKQYLGKVGPTLQKHLDQALALQKKMGKSKS